MSREHDRRLTWLADGTGDVPDLVELRLQAGVAQQGRNQLGAFILRERRRRNGADAPAIPQHARRGIRAIHVEEATVRVMAATLQVAHTADLGAEALHAARALLDDVFGAEMEDEDWDHALGGVHTLVWEEQRLVGHASVVQRRLLHAGRALRTGYVEGVAVRADRRRRGHGTAMMEALERVIRGAYELGALGASEDGVRLYEQCGWRPWQGRLFALTPAGVIPTAEEEGDVYVLETSVALERTGELTCDWRDGDVW